MKKNIIKAFTLVEMLIVIVIIGILIAALMPRMQSAQGRARDVSRKNDLSQIQTAIVTSQQDKGDWPKPEAEPENADGENEGDEEDSTNTETDVSNGISVRKIEKQLITAGMSSVPGDPLKSNSVKGLGTTSNEIKGEYGYIVVTKNGTEEGGFVLMAKTEIEGSSNRVYCGDSATLIDSDTDIAKEDEFKLCTSFSKNPGGSDCGNTNGVCTYNEDDQLRYVITY